MCLSYVLVDSVTIFFYHFRLYFVELLAIVCYRNFDLDNHTMDSCSAGTSPVLPDKDTVLL